MVDKITLLVYNDSVRLNNTLGATGIHGPRKWGESQC